MCIRDSLELVVLALDGAGLLEGVAQALVHEALEALLLHGDQVRQLHRLRDLPEVDACALGGGHGLCGAVSYTHLDVYKRQGYSSTTMSPSFRLNSDGLNAHSTGCRQSKITFV